MLAPLTLLSALKANPAKHDKQNINTSRWAREAARAMWVDTLIDASIYREWAVNVGRRNGRRAMCHLLIRRARFVEVPDRARLSKIAGFNELYSHLDLLAAAYPTQAGAGGSSLNKSPNQSPVRGGCYSVQRVHRAF